MIDDLTKEFIMKLARYSRNEAFLITALASLDEPYQKRQLINYLDSHKDATTTDINIEILKIEGSI